MIIWFFSWSLVKTSCKVFIWIKVTRKSVFASNNNILLFVLFAFVYVNSVCIFVYKCVHCTHHILFAYTNKNKKFPIVFAFCLTQYFYLPTGSLFSIQNPQFEKFTEPSFSKSNRIFIVTYYSRIVSMRFCGHADL